MEIEKIFALLAGIGLTGIVGYFGFSKTDEPSLTVTTETKTTSVIDTFSSLFSSGGDNPETVRNDIINRARTDLRESLISKEGYRNDVYRDSLGKNTVGIGHLVLPSDNLSFGQVISDAQVDAFYLSDSTKAFNSAITQADELDKFDSEFIVALAHVNFQLGTGWNRTFSNTWNLLKTGNYKTAINNLNNSLWAKQTPVRVAEFTNAIQQVYTA